MASGHQRHALGLIGLQLSVPLYQGGAISSRVRQAIANQEKARQDLETARRSAQLLAQTSFSGVTNGVAQVRAFEQALASAQVSYDSNKLGLEVGVRTNLDVLNQQQQVFQTRFSLAQSYYNFIINASAAQTGGRYADRRGCRGASIAIWERRRPRTGGRQVDLRSQPVPESLHGAPMRGVKCSCSITHRLATRRIRQEIANRARHFIGIGDEARRRPRRSRRPLLRQN